MDIVTYALAKNYADTVGKPTPEEIGAAVDAYLEEHQVAAGMKRIVYTLSKSGNVYSLKDSEGNNVNFDTLFTTIKDEKNYVVVLYGNSKLRPQYVSTNEIHCDGIDRDSSTTRFLRMVMTYSSLTYATFELAEKTDLNNYVANTEKGAVNGVATLDSNGRLTSTQLPNGTTNKIETVKVNGTALVPDSNKAVNVDLSELAEKTYVDNAIDALPEPMVFKGSLGTGGTITTLPTASNTNKGFTYKVITNGTYAGQVAKQGDTFISDGSAWVLIPSGDEPSGTVTSVGLSVPTGFSVTGSPVTKRGTIAINMANGYSIPTTAKQNTWDAKQDALTFNTSPSSTNKVATMADVTKANVGLSNVNNTSDADKPISNAAQAALNGKQNTLTFMTTPSSTNKVATKTEIDAEDAQIADIYNRASGGKNLAKLKINPEEFTSKGITPTINSDGSVTLQGTATAQIGATLSEYVDVPIGTAFIVSGISGGSSTTYDMRANGCTPGTLYDGEIEVVTTRNPNVYLGMVIRAGVTIDITLKPMLRPASIKDGTFVPYTPTNSELYETTKTIGEDLAQVNDKVEKILKKEAKIYGFNILKNESDPAARVVYTDDAVGMTPAGISGTDTFSYGSWKDAFFMPRPCMIKSNGTVDYYLNPNNFKEKLDGTTSDVTNLAYDGNAMMEWDKIYWKYIPTNDEIEGGFRVSNVKVDDTYHCWCNINNDDKEVDHFYTNIYNGTGTDKLRSISGIQLSPANGNGNTNTTTETTRAQANGTGWYIETWADRLLMTGLLLLMGKSTNTQAVFGAGLTGGAQADKEAYITGTLDDKGLFYGSTDTMTSVKCFGMENFYGCVLHRVAGCILSSYKLLTKLTWGKADGSTVVGYNRDGIGYVETATSAKSEGYIKAMNFTERGFVASDTTGTSTTYYCDGFFTNTKDYYLLVGGHAANGTYSGACCLRLYSAEYYSNWNIAAALSFKPLV